MKRSTIFLIAALAVPAIISLAAVTAGIQKIKPVEGSENTGSLDQLFSQIDGDLEIIHEAQVPIAQSFKLLANAAQINLQFDPKMQGQAKVKVESKTPKLATVEIKDSEMSFSPTESGEPLRITLTLPVQFISFAVDLNASRCDVRADTEVNIENLVISAQAAKCDLTFASLNTQRLTAEVNAGDVTFKATNWVGRDFDWEVNAGNIEVQIDQLSFLDPGLGRFRIESSTGNGVVRIKNAPLHSVDAQVEMGKLELDIDGHREEISGMNQEHRTQGPDGSPTFELKVNMGNLELTIDKSK